MTNNVGLTPGPESESHNSAPPQPTDLGPASALRRSIAFLVDVGLVAAFHFTAGGRRWLLAAIFFALYHTVSLAVWGRTLGKAVMALTVQHPDGTRLGWTPALLRSTVGYLASAFCLLGFVRILFDARHRGWHDSLFGSEVVQQPGALSFTQLIRTIDRWTEELDAWQRRVLARFNRLRGLIQLVATLTLFLQLVTNGVEQLITLLSKGLKQLGRVLGRAVSRPAATASAEGYGAGSAGVAASASATTGALAAATSTVSALVLAGATVVIYQVSAPPAIRPWDAGRSTVLRECNGTITASITRGYIGDPVEVAIRIDPPFDKTITHVTTNNPGCMGCVATQTGPGRFIWRGRFAEPPGTARVEFVAFDKEGNVRCRGHTTELTILGPRPQ